MKLPEFQYLLPGRYRASDALEYNHPAHGWVEVTQDGFYREIREVVGDLPPQFNIGTMTPNQARRMFASGKTPNAQIVRQDSSVRSTSGPDLAHDPKNGWTLNGVPIQEMVEDAISDCETVSQVRMALHDLGLLKGYRK